MSWRGGEGCDTEAVRKALLHMHIMLRAYLTSFADDTTEHSKEMDIIQ